VDGAGTAQGAGEEEHLSAVRHGNWRTAPDTQTLGTAPSGSDAHPAWVPRQRTFVAESSPLEGALFFHSSDAVLVATADARYVDANPAACALLGYEFEELMTLGVSDVVAAPAEWSAAQYDAYAAAGTWRGELSVRRRDGRLVTVESVATAVPQGGRTLYVAVLRDVSVRVEAQTAADDLAASQLLAAENLYEKLFTGAPLAMIIATPDATVLRANTACCELLGYSEDRLVGKQLGALTHPEDLAASLAVRAGFRAGTMGSSRQEKRYIHADGRVVWAAVTASVLLGRDGQPHGLAAVLEDITRRREAEETLARERAFTDAVLDEIDVGVAAFDRDGRLTVFNRFSREKSPLVTVGMSRDEWRGYYDFLRPDGTPLPDAELPLTRALQGDRVRGDEIVIGTAAGRRTVIFSARPLVDRAGARLGAVVSSLDVTAGRLAEASLIRQARHDVLTGLPNRAMLTDRLAGVLDAQLREPGPFALFVVNLDDFQNVNDRLGHDVGDSILVRVAGRLQRAWGQLHTVAHLGGDEFAVLVERTSDAEAMSLAGAIRETIHEPLEVQGQHVACSASVGVVVGRPGDSAERLLRDAGLAMAAAKSTGKGNVAAFEPWMHQNLVDRLLLDGALEKALHEEQLRLVYQPIIDLPTGHLMGFEALCRWDRADTGAIPPTTFIPRAEATGLIIPLGAWVLTTAIRQAARWQASFPHVPPLTMSVNLSAHQLTAPHLVATVADALTATGFAPDRVIFEITESAVMRAEGLQTLDSLHALGVLLAVDDFGTGFSSLGRLHSLPIHIVKIDKSFVDGIRLGQPSPIVTATIAVAKALGLDTVAEGVETTAQAEFLRTQGCDKAQGYLFGRPVEVSDIDLLLASGTTVLCQLPDG